LNLPSKVETLTYQDVGFDQYVLGKMEFFASIGKKSEEIKRACDLVVHVFKNSGKLLICGNGGSASDSNHIATEFVNGMGSNFKYPLPAISLAADNSVITSCGNDYDFSEIYSSQIAALGEPTDLLFALSTSGKSKNILLALESAKAKGMKTLILTGSVPNPRVNDLADVVVSLPSTNTQSVQEGMIIVFHYICGYVIEHMRDISR
jgi:D-sedoheptulose 7-phosphate isomerase